MFLTRIKPEKGLSRYTDMEDVFDNLFCDEFEGLTGNLELVPAVDMLEDKENIMVTAEIPGVEQKDVSVTIENDILAIQGEKKSLEEVKEKNYCKVERRYGSFTRNIVLPAPVQTEKVTAVFKNGVLTVTLPKSEESKPKTTKIEVK
ncbi:MAG: Hsp20/alpha crystallin family protein [Planctomycetes bacterium]|nr:Hsp20/alpha crystallin family protein [Planctomycetota bacterium]